MFIFSIARIPHYVMEYRNSMFYQPYGFFSITQQTVRLNTFKCLAHYTLQANLLILH